MRFVCLPVKRRDVRRTEETALVQVGRYQVLETLGTGAQSRVVRAHDPLIDRCVAIKLFSPELARGEKRSHFLREARVVGKLSHPSVITVHDMGIEESTQVPYLVMELVEGQSLEKLIAKGSIPYPSAFGGPPARRNSRGHQAREYFDHRGEPCEADGLRDGAAGGASERGFCDTRNAGVLVPGTDSGARAGCAVGCFLAGRGAVRDAHGIQPVQRDVHSNVVQSNFVVVAAAAVALQSVDSAGTGRNRDVLFGEGATIADGVGGGSCRGAFPACATRSNPNTDSHRCGFILPRPRRTFA